MRRNAVLRRPRRRPGPRAGRLLEHEAPSATSTSSSAAAGSTTSGTLAPRRHRDGVLVPFEEHQLRDRRQFRAELAVPGALPDHQPASLGRAEDRWLPDGVQRAAMPFQCRRENADARLRPVHYARSVLVPVVDGRDHMHPSIWGRVPHGDGRASLRREAPPFPPAEPGLRRYPSMVPSVYEAAGGRAGMLRLAHAWHERVLADEVVSHAFSHGFHPEHTERLAAYWAEALGGPDDYSQSMGDETSVVRMHSGNGPHDEMDRRAIACFDQALTDVGFERRRPGASGALRLLRLGHDDHDGAVSRLRGRRPGRSGHSPLDVGRAGRGLR